MDWKTNTGPFVADTVAQETSETTGDILMLTLKLRKTISKNQIIFFLQYYQDTKE